MNSSEPALFRLGPRLGVMMDGRQNIPAKARLKAALENAPREERLAPAADCRRYESFRPNPSEGGVLVRRAALRDFVQALGSLCAAETAPLTGG